MGDMWHVAEKFTIVSNVGDDYNSQSRRRLLCDAYNSDLGEEDVVGFIQAVTTVQNLL